MWKDEVRRGASPQGLPGAGALPLPEPMDENGPSSGPVPSQPIDEERCPAVAPMAREGVHLDRPVRKPRVIGGIQRYDLGGNTTGGVLFSDAAHDFDRSAVGRIERTQNVQERLSFHDNNSR